MRLATRGEDEVDDVARSVVDEFEAAVIRFGRVAGVIEVLEAVSEGGRPTEICRCCRLKDGVVNL